MICVFVAHSSLRLRRGCGEGLFAGLGLHRLRCRRALCGWEVLLVGLGLGFVLCDSTQ